MFLARRGAGAVDDVEMCGMSMQATSLALYYKTQSWQPLSIAPYHTAIRVPTTLLTAAMQEMNNNQAQYEMTETMQPSPAPPPANGASQQEVRLY